MGLLDAFKKKEEKELDYDPLDIKITDLKKGYFVEYDLATWEVTAVYRYDWGDNHITYEYQLKSDNDTCYLHIDYDDEMELTVSKKIKLRHIDEDLEDVILEEERPPKKIKYNGKTFYREGESPGYFNEFSEDTSTWIEFISWEYYDDDEEEFINIEQWEDEEFAAAIGKVVNEIDFSNIVPAQQDDDV